MFLGVVVLLASGYAAFRHYAALFEARLSARIERMARSAGLNVRYEMLRVGLSPLVRIARLTIEQPGKGTIAVEDVTVWPQFRGPRGWGLLGRVHVGAVRVDLPADLEARLHPTVWEVDPDVAIFLRAPVEGLAFTAGRGPKGRAFDLVANRLNLDAIGAMALEGDASKALGFVNGRVHLEGDPRRDFQATWRFDGLGGEGGGALIVLPGKPDAKVQFQSAMKGLDFARVLRSLGVDAPSTPKALGSVSGTISVGGLLHDPATLEVIQQIDFRKPDNMPREIAKLRDSFDHEVTTSAGEKRVFRVGPGPDFIALSNVPPLLLRALLIAEDANFWGHPGIDLTELPKAIAINIAKGERARGGSTITQQLAKNLFLTREKSLQRKLRELSYAFLLESGIGKARILEIYLNAIEWGPGLYGLRPAARHYFRKEPQELTPREIAFLVTLIPGPVKYQGSIEQGELRRGFGNMVNALLAKLRSVDAITDGEYQTALTQALNVRGENPYFTEYQGLPGEPADAQAPGDVALTPTPTPTPRR